MNDDRPGAPPRLTQQEIDGFLGDRATRRERHRGRRLTGATMDTTVVTGRVAKPTDETYEVMVRDEADGSIKVHASGEVEGGNVRRDVEIAMIETGVTYLGVAIGGGETYYDADEVERQAMYGLLPDLAAKSRAGKHRDALRRAVLGMGDDDSLTASELARKVGLNAADARPLIDEMIAEGRLAPGNDKATRIRRGPHRPTRN
jgi:hypothetical protein